MSAPELIRVRIVVREVTKYERTVLMPPAQLESLQAQLASGTAEAKADVAMALFDGELIDNGTAEDEDDLLDVLLTPLPTYTPDSDQEATPC